MIGDHEHDPLDDLGATWMGDAAELAFRADALADEFDVIGAALPKDACRSWSEAARMLRDVLSREHNPITGRRPSAETPKDAR